MEYRRYVAIGDSFTEGVGDHRQDGSLRGWADLTAAELAAQALDGIRYANLAVRGKLLGQIVDDQLEPALALGPDLVSFAAGGNDVLRPRADITGLLRLFDQVVARIRDRGVQVLLFTGADPSEHLPMSRTIRAHGDRYCQGVRAIADSRGATLVDLWAEEELRDLRFWDADRLHLNAVGHHRVAAQVLTALGAAAPADWSQEVPPLPDPAHPLREEAAYYRGYVLPWVQRRLTGKSSGDEVTAKRPTLEPAPSEQLRQA